ncbi:MAG TPA: CPBP family intramembrane glutamic endopeptidase [Hanamia sp.]|nr:CPBP family intramembrane glutamic endopeptidase [Hanamia sp.]
MQSQIKQTPLQKALHFFVTKMIIGIGVIILLVAAIEWLRSSILDKTNLPDDIKALMVSVAEAFIATTGYIFLFRMYDKRPIYELSASTFFNNATVGFLTGISLQSLFILIIYLTGTFLIVNINPVSALISPFAFALTAGFVAEIIIIGIVFRLLEQQTGTIMALFIFIILFAILHINVKGATLISVGATAMQAGLLLPAAYVYRRNLWLPIFLHFGWDFAEPGIFGGINPSDSMTHGLLTSKIAGNSLFTGGETGPQDSLLSLLLCLILGLIFLSLAKQKNNLVKPQWKTKATNKNIATSGANE